MTTNTEAPAVTWAHQPKEIAMYVFLPHEQRVVDEKSELDTKAHALSQFIGYSPIFNKIDPTEQERLKMQNDVMWQYSEILGARIAWFADKTGAKPILPVDDVLAQAQE